MPTLHLQFLGRFHITYDGTPVVALQQARRQSLLAYLILNRDTPQPRRRLAYLFWPDSTEIQAHNNLRKAIHWLRNSLPDADHFLLVDTSMVRWRSEASFELDVDRFEQLLSQATHAKTTGDPARSFALLQQAVEVYQGDLLPDCYDDWLLPERDRLRERYIEAVLRLVDQLELAREYEAAIRQANDLLRVDPLHEATYRRLMRLYVLCDNRAAALRVYQMCATILRRELDVEPSPPTQEAYDQLLYLESLPFVAVYGTPNQDECTQKALVGRRTEWQRLFMTWQQISRRGIHLALITGQAGIGKTRLADELYRWVSRQGIPAARARAYAAAGAVAYAPIAEWLRTEPLRVGWRQLENLWQSELVRLLPELLIELPELPRPEPLAESWQRKRFLDALVQAILATNQPLLLWLDDMQWCDQETLEWLAYLFYVAGEATAKRQPPLRLLVLGTVRIEEIAEKQPLALLLSTLRQAGQLTELELGALSSDETAVLAAQLTGETWSAERASTLYAQTEGYPLFVVEILKGGEANRTRIAQDAFTSSLPLKVQAVIQARLDLLSSTARELAALAATIGRAFPVCVLIQAARAMSAHSTGKAEEWKLVQGLDELWQRQILREQESDTYDFSHDKIREVAYAGISPARRRLLHRWVAEALEQIYTVELDALSGQIAAHYAQASLPAEAVEYYARAAGVAQRTFAYSEASRQVQQGLVLLDQLPLTPQRLRQELRLQIAHGESLQALYGPSAPETRTAYLRAHALAGKINMESHETDFGIILEQLKAIGGLGFACLSQAQFGPAQQWRELALTFAKQAGNRQWIREVLSDLGAHYLFCGKFQQSRFYFEQVLSEPNQPWPPATSLDMTWHVGAFQRSLMSLILWHLGYPEQALSYMEKAWAIAQTANHPYSYASVLTFAARLYQLRREPSLAQSWAQKAIDYAAHRQGVPYWTTHAQVILGWALAQQGEIDEGIAYMRDALATRTATQHLIHRPAFLGMLADGYSLSGQIPAGLQIVDEAIGHAEATGEHMAEAELFRLQGALLQRQQADPLQVEACLQRALGIARRQEAKSLELRAALSLSQLWMQQGKPQAAHVLLAPIYGWFTEGLETSDLREARELLIILAACHHSPQ